MKGLLRRLRGAIKTGLTWGVGWSAVFAGLAAILGSSLRQVGMAAFVGSAYGLVAGVSFAAILSIAERRRTLDQLSLRRVALWGAIGGAVLVLWAVPSMLNSGFSLGQILGPEFLLRASIVTLLGAGFSSGSVAIARRGEFKSIEGDDEPLPALEG